MANRRQDFILVASALLMGCAPAADEPATEQATAEQAAAPEAISRQQLDQLRNDQVAAFHAGDAARIGSLYASDGIFVSARGKVENAQAITEFWTQALQGDRGKSVNLETLKSGSSGDLAWTLSHYTGGVTAPSGHVLAVVRRQPDGSLKLVAQVSIPDPSN